MSWKVENIPSLKEKTIIITGGNSGIGLEAAKVFCSKGADVVLACRSRIKGSEAKSLIEKENKEAKVHVMELDLADLSSIKNFPEEFQSKFKSLDVLLNNAGIMMSPYHTTKDGFEAQLGINHLGHFALTGRLLPMLKASPGSRVVNISSLAHKRGEMDFDNLLFDNGKGYSALKAYGRSKLANLLFTYQLQRNFEKAGAECISLAAHPGVSKTNLARYIEKNILFRLLNFLFRNFAQDADMGALPGIRASVDPAAKGGEYYGPDGKGERKGNPVLVDSNDLSKDVMVAEKLWKASEELTDVTYDF